MNVDKLIEKGDEALRKRNYDYAISIFLEAVSFSPNNRKAREGLRTSELKKYERSYPGRIAVAIFGMGAKLGMFFAGLGRKKNPEGYMMACERFLKLDPKNLKVNRLLGDAAAEAGHVDAAIFAYETAAEHHPEDVTALKSLGNLLWRKGEIRRAHDVFDKVVHLSPQDQEAVKARKNLAAEASLKETGFERAKSSRELVKDKDQASKLEAEVRMYRTEEDLDHEKAELEKKVEADPENVVLMQDLAETLQKMKDYDGAVAVLDRALKVRPNDTGIQFERGDLVMQKIEEQIYALNRAGKKQEAARKEKELVDFKVEEFTRRVRAYPTDLNYRFRLGELLLLKGKLDEAIGEFQKTVRDPKYKADSQIKLGEAFAQKQQFDLAVRQLEQALESQTGMNERVKAIHYALGGIHEKRGDDGKARDEYGKVYEVDIHYKDVGDRIAALEKKGAGSGKPNPLKLEE